MHRNIKKFLQAAHYLRLRQGLTIAQLSEETGLSPMTISRLENGNMEVGIQAHITLAHFFHVDLDALVRNDFQSICATLTHLTPPAHAMYDHYAQVIAIQQKNGQLGEDFVFQEEAKKLEQTVMANAVSSYADCPECAHFDIMSFDEHDASPIVIEVKTTNRGPDTPFIMTEAELSTAKDCLELGIRYEIHRVYYVNQPDNIGRMIISAEELFSKFTFSPPCYRVERSTI